MLLMLLTVLLPLEAALGGGREYYEDAVERFRLGDYNGAIIQLKNALKHKPGFLPAKILLGRAYLAEGDEQAAEQVLRVARQQGADPNSVAVALANAYLEQKK